MNEAVDASEVLDFWLGPEAARDAPAKEFVARWFAASPDFDAELAARFGRGLELAARGGFDAWAENPRGRVALVILLDQFTRNIHRGTARMFENDPKALSLAQDGVDLGVDRDLRAAERQFLYMPFMHAESLPAQLRSLFLFEQLAHDAPNLDQRVWAVRHHDIVKRFGCFPHRSHLLGRSLSAEEVEFLKQPNSSF